LASKRQSRRHLGTVQGRVRKWHPSSLEDQMKAAGCSEMTEHGQRIKRFTVQEKLRFPSSRRESMWGGIEA